MMFFYENYSWHSNRKGDFYYDVYNILKSDSIINIIILGPQHLSVIYRATSSGTKVRTIVIKVKVAT